MSARRFSGDSSLHPPFRLDATRSEQEIAFPPIFAGDRLLFVRRWGVLDAFDERTGERVWRVALAGPADRSQPHTGAPLVEDDLVHAWAGGEFISVDLASGEIANRRPAPALDLHDGAFLDRCVVSHIEEGRLEAWDIAKGVSRWSIPCAFDPVPIAGEGTFVVVANLGSITAYDVGDGRVLWTSALEASEAIGALAIAPNGSVLTALSKEIVALDAATGSVRWKAAAEVARPGTMAVTGDGEIHLLDLKRYRRLSALTGSVLLSHDLDRTVLPTVRGSLGRLSVSRSHVFAGDQRGPLVSISRATGAVDWTWDETRQRAASDALVISGRRLYALAFDGSLQTFVEAG